MQVKGLRVASAGVEEGGVRPRGMVGVGGVPPKKEEKDRVKGKGVTDRLWSVGPGCRVGDRDGGGGLVGGGFSGLCRTRPCSQELLLVLECWISHCSVMSMLSFSLQEIE